MPHPISVHDPTEESVYCPTAARGFGRAYARAQPAQLKKDVGHMNDHKEPAATVLLVGQVSLAYLLCAVTEALLADLTLSDMDTKPGCELLSLLLLGATSTIGEEAHGILEHFPCS